jgi:hypothetical protein
MTAPAFTSPSHDLGYEQALLAPVSRAWSYAYAWRFS